MVDGSVAIIRRLRTYHEKPKRGALNPSARIKAGKKIQVARVGKCFMCQGLMPTTSYTGVAFDAALVADVSDAELDGLGMPSDCHVEHGADTCPAYQFI